MDTGLGEYAECQSLSAPSPFPSSTPDSMGCDAMRCDSSPSAGPEVERVERMLAEHRAAAAGAALLADAARDREDTARPEAESGNQCVR